MNRLELKPLMISLSEIPPRRPKIRAIAIAISPILRFSKKPMAIHATKKSSDIIERSMALPFLYEIIPNNKNNDHQELISAINVITRQSKTLFTSIVYCKILSPMIIYQLLSRIIATLVVSSESVTFRQIFANGG